jgi:hypothetical protein
MSLKLTAPAFKIGLRPEIVPNDNNEMYRLFTFPSISVAILQVAVL